MVSSQDIKRTLIQEIDQLPDEKLQEVLGFVRQLLVHPKLGMSQPTVNEVYSEPDASADADPLSTFIGAGSHGSLAKTIDQDLYGA